MIFLKIADEPSTALSGMPRGKAAMKATARALNHVPDHLKPPRASLMPPSRTEPSDSDQSGGEELTISGKHAYLHIPQRICPFFSFLTKTKLRRFFFGL